jgi:hypothetical protein
VELPVVFSQIQLPTLVNLKTVNARSTVVVGTAQAAITVVGELINISKLNADLSVQLEPQKVQSECVPLKSPNPISGVAPW